LGADLDVPTVLALQGTIGNAQVSRLIDPGTGSRGGRRGAADGPRAATPRDELEIAAAEAESVGEAMVQPAGPVADRRLQRQRHGGATATPTVDPALAALWGSSVVAAIDRAATAIHNAPANPGELNRALEELGAAKRNAETTRGQITDNPVIRRRIEALFGTIRRLHNKLIMLTRPEAVTFPKAADVARDGGQMAARLGPRLRAAGGGTTTSSATSSRIVRALWQSNVTTKINALPRRLRHGAAADAQATVGEVESALVHIRGLRDAYANDPANLELFDEVNRVGVRLSDLKNILAFLADGTHEDVADLATEADNIKGEAERVFQ
jgi:hypothetical protein